MGETEMGQENVLQCTRLEQMCITNNLTVLIVQVKVKLAGRNHFLPDDNNSYHLTQHLRDTYRPLGQQGRKNSL